MKISIDQLKQVVYQVGRTLLTPHPTYANGAIAMSFAIETERRRQGKPLLDVWFEIHDQNKTYYIIEKSSGGGEYLRQLPLSVAQESVVKIVIPKDTSPAFDIMDQLEGLLRKFQETTRFTDEPTHEVLELEGGPTAQQQIGDLLILIGNIRLATHPGYDEQMMSQLIGQLNIAAQNYASSKDFSQLERSVSIIRKTSEAIRTSLLSDCLLASFFLVFHDLCTTIFEYHISSGKEKTQAEAEYLRRITELGTTSKLDPLSLLQFTTVRALSDGNHEIVTRLAKQYYKNGRDLIIEALDALTRDLHGDVLYRAAFVLFSARQLFKVLLSSAPLPPGVDVEELEKLSHVSEENMVKVQDALLFALRNRGDELLEAQRKRFQVLVNHATSTVQTKITELIEQKFYYPRIFRECLEGGVKVSKAQSTFNVMDNAERKIQTLEIQTLTPEEKQNFIIALRNIKQTAEAALALAMQPAPEDGESGEPKPSKNLS